eukprot:g48063.t1
MDGKRVLYYFRNTLEKWKSDWVGSFMKSEDHEEIRNISDSVALAQHQYWEHQPRDVGITSWASIYYLSLLATLLWVRSHVKARL